MRLLAIVYGIILCPIFANCQTLLPDSAGSPSIPLSSVTVSKLNSTYSSMNASVNTQAKSMLHDMEKKENRIRAILAKRDSTGAQQLYTSGLATYRNLESKLQSAENAPATTLRNYIPGIDSMQTAIRFLSGTALPAGQLAQLQALGTRLTQLQGSLQNAGEVQDFVTTRMTQLQAQLSQYNLASRLASMNTTVFNYQQQLAQYKSILNNRQKQEQIILSTIRQLPAFQTFWQKNSMLAQLFPPPANAGTLLSGAGLQTGAQVGRLIQQKLGTALDDSGSNAAQYLQEQAGDAQPQMDQLSSKLDKLNIAGGSSNMILPDNVPNSQHGKTFFKRLELGFNLQNTASTPLLPAISTLGLNLGYRLSDKATVGIGASYLMGLGYGFNHIRLSNQGAGLRSFLDIKAIKTIWVTGGFEYNYMQQFDNIHDIGHLDTWQKSALLGLMKQFNLGKHSGNFQLLYDFLAGEQTPHGQPLVFRCGYSL
ncbi:MAG TPA: hypothetical protein VGS79_04240 [Puia sp.]|nr:hypothetical protein [Puia sp.]